MASPPVPIILPRSLIFLASIWLIASWLIAIGFVPPVQPSSTSYQHGLLIMLLCVSTGVMVGWPLLRLSQEFTAAPLRQTLLDMIVVASMIQVILWPIRLVTAWTPGRTAAIDMTLLGWLLLVGATIAAAIGTARRGPRNLAMITCIAMCLLGPALTFAGVLVGVRSISLVELSPLMAIRTLGGGGPAPVEPGQWRLIILLMAAGAIVWTGLAVWTATQASDDV